MSKPVRITLITAGSQTITIDNSFGTLSLTIMVNPAGVSSLVLSPSNPTITAGGSQTFTAEGFDQYGNDIGNVTGATIFSIIGRSSAMRRAVKPRLTSLRWRV